MKIPRLQARPATRLRARGGRRIPLVLLGLVLCASGAWAYEVVGVENGGTVTGIVRFENEYPEREYIKVDRDAATCGVRHLSEEFIVNPESKGLKNVVGVLLGVEKGKPFPESSKLSLDQTGCTYEPHVQIGFAPDGGAPSAIDLTIQNSDDVFHNVHAFGEGEVTLFNTPSIPSRAVTKQITGPGVYRLKCDIHTWMSAWIVVVDHPYVAISDENGRFQIEGVPPGEYTLRVWHEALGSIERTVTVTAGEESVVEVVLGKGE